MGDRFIRQPILNSPYVYPKSHWELDESGQPTQQAINRRRRAEFKKMIEQATGGSI